MKFLKKYKYKLSLVILFLFLMGSFVLAKETIKDDVINFIFEDGLVGGIPVSVAVDPGGWVWIGTRSIDNSNSGGFSIVNSNERIITFNKKDGIASNNVNSIAFDSERKFIWFATDNGVSRWNGKTGRWKNYNKSNSNLKGNLINKIYLDSKGNLLIASNDSGVYQMTPSGKVNSVKCPFNQVTDVIIDKKGRMWASSHKGLAFRQDNIWVTYNKKNSSIPVEQVDALIEFSDGSILGATQNGIIVYDGYGWSLIDTSNSKLPVDLISGFMKDNEGHFWVTTMGGGVVRLNKSRKIDKFFNRKNVNILDNRVSSMTQDGCGNFWLCTKRGVSKIVMNITRVTDENLQGITKAGYEWYNCANNQNSPTKLQLGLVRPHYVPVVWSWVAFFADKGYEPLEPKVSIESSLLNNQWLNVSGIFPEASFVHIAFSRGRIIKNLSIQRDKSFPFPDKMPPEVKIYLKPGNLIPSSDPKIVAMAKSMVKKLSKKDMLKTAEDIIFSKTFSTMPFDYKAQVETNKKDVESINPRVGFYASCKRVLKENKGVGYSKNRLACAFLKAAGIPARLIAGNGYNYWGEAYIHGYGWIPFDVSKPVYTIGNDSDERLSFPSVIKAKNSAVVFVSNSGDNLKQLVWTPLKKAILARQKSLKLKKVITPEKIKKAKFLLVYPSSWGHIPYESKIPVAPNVFMAIQKEKGKYNIKFFNEEGKLTSREPIEKFDATMTVGSKGDYQITFIPTMMGEHIMLRIFKWSYYKAPAE